MKTIEEQRQSIWDRKTRLFQERAEIKAMLDSIQKQQWYLEKKLQDIETNTKDCNRMMAMLSEYETE